MPNGLDKEGRLPVVIVGGGPVGLGLALELAWRGIRSRLIDQGDGVVRLSKMGAVSVRSMEHCRRWGVAEDVRNAGFPADYPLDQIFCTSLNGELVGRIAFPSHAKSGTGGTSPERKQRCPQLWFDPVLQRKAAAEPLITLSYETRLVGFADHGDRVTADVENLRTGAAETIEAQYMAGCDGGGSAVRAGLGYKLEGDRLSNSVGIYFTSVGLHDHHVMGKGTRYWMIGEDGTWGNLTVVDGSDVWRLTVSGSNVPVDMGEFDADAWLRRCLGSEDIDYVITAVLPWWRNRMVADHYGRGRVWLAGDACHMNAPNGGFGMNTGLGDSVDLGWKLQAVIEGWGAPELLSAYELERRPIAVRNVNAAAANFLLTKPTVSYAGVEEPGAEGDARRAALFEVLAAESMPEFKTEGVHLGYRYEDSPIVVPDGTDEPTDDLVEYVPTARPGHRAPHFALADGRSVLDLFGHAFVLLEFGDGDVADAIGEAAARIGMPFETVSIDDPTAARLYERRFVLVRPDGHVAWRGDALDHSADEIVAVITGHRLAGTNHEAVAAAAAGAR